MKLQAEYENVKAKVETIDRNKITEYMEKVKQAGNYKNFEIRIANDILHAAVNVNEICEWYKKHNCHDEHITTLAIKVCKDLKIL